LSQILLRYFFFGRTISFREDNISHAAATLELVVIPSVIVIFQRGEGSTHAARNAPTDFTITTKEPYSMKTFEVQFSYQDRDKGKVESTLKVDASSLPGGVAKATREFVKSLDRKQRFDMNKSGLEITARPADAAVDAPTKSSAEAATG